MEGVLGDKLAYDCVTYSINYNNRGSRIVAHKGTTQEVTPRDGSQ